MCMGSARRRMKAHPTMLWGGASGHNYRSLLWARIFQGIGLAPFEALVNASVGDLYFVHESGKRMAF